jgi:hypothetical protein
MEVLSLLQRELKSNAENIARSAPVQVTAEQPSFNHIKLETLSMEDIITFVDDVTEYESAHSLNLPASTLISSKVRDQIIAHNPGLNERKFHSATFEELVKLINKEVRPTSKLSFRRMLQKHTKFVAPTGYQPYTSSFKEFYTALLLYRRRFTRIYEILSTENEENIPQADNKPGGLIKVFIDAIPFNYGVCVYELLKDQAAKFENIYQFLISFYQEVELDYTRNEGHRQFLTHFTGTATAASAPGRKLLELANIRAESYPGSFGFTDAKSPSPNRRDAAAIIDEEDDIFNPEEPADYLDSNGEPSLSSPDHYQQSGTFGQFGQSRPTDSERRGCLSQLLRGACSDSRCKYSHDVEDLETTRVFMV